ncbi:MAG TPA: hypothetical protein VI451_13870 [Anaerolineales bacterium]|nr:hypothetical protein [Anaerolineales bacterium]
MENILADSEVPIVLVDANHPSLTGPAGFVCQPGQDRGHEPASGPGRVEGELQPVVAGHGHDGQAKRQDHGRHRGHQLRGCASTDV